MEILFDKRVFSLQL